MYEVRTCFMFLYQLVFKFSYFITPFGSLHRIILVQTTPQRIHHFTVLSTHYITPVVHLKVKDHNRNKEDDVKQIRIIIYIRFSHTHRFEPVSVNVEIRRTERVILQ